MAKMTFQARRSEGGFSVERPDAGAPARYADATGWYLLPSGVGKAGLKIQGAGGGVRIKRVTDQAKRRIRPSAVWVLVKPSHVLRLAQDLARHSNIGVLWNHFRLVAGPDTIFELLLLRVFGSNEEREWMAARLVGERPVGQRVRHAVAEMVGWRRDLTASMISEGSMPCR